MPKQIKKKIVKKSTPETEVKGIISKLKGFTTQRKNTFIAAAGAIIIFAASVAGFLIYNSRSKNTAEKFEYEAYKTYYGLYLKQPVAKEERHKKAADLFKKAYDAGKSPVSLFYLANCYYELGRYADALNTLKELNQKFPDDERFVPLSYNKMAMASMKSGNNEDALKYLDILYKYKTGTFKDLALIESAKILETVGRTEEANKKYEEVLKDFSQSPFAEEAQSRIQKGKG